jgi:hypothetical protein
MEHWINADSGQQREAATVRLAAAAVAGAREEWPGRPGMTAVPACFALSFRLLRFRRRSL